MKKKELTTASIRRIDDPGNITCNISVSDVKAFTENPNILIIQSITQGCTRLTIYPVDKDDILKISLSGSNISEQSITDLSNILQNYEMIHTSGLLIKAEELYYECYLNLSESDDKTKDLKSSLDTIRLSYKIKKIEL